MRNLADAVGGPDPICGNWCGANRRYMGDDPQPVDDLVAACWKHDFCTREQRIGLSGKGPSCFCDQQLADEIRRGRNIVSLSPAENSVVMHLQGSACGGGCKRVDNLQVCEGDALAVMRIPQDFDRIDRKLLCLMKGECAPSGREVGAVIGLSPSAVQGASHGCAKAA